MKITITHDFDTVDAAEEFLSRLSRPGAAQSAQSGSLPAEPEKRARKPRADAGKVRGAYKPREDARADNTTGGPSASEPGITGGDSASAQPAATVSPPQPAAPVKSPATEPSQAAQAPTAVGSVLTLADLRLAMELLNAVPSKGMTANVAALRTFGVLRVSELPPAKYAEFEAYVRAQLPTPVVG
jgi:hypothetical protein